MNDKAALLNQLRIDRGGEVARDVRRPWSPWVAGALFIILLAAGGWWYLSRNTGIAVHAVAARAVTSQTGASAGGASLLDASGYVVARRMATVASKIIGRVDQVLIEEGQKVAKDQIIARLDDSNTRAEVAEAQAQLAQDQASLQAAKVAMDDARPIFERTARERAAAVISAQDFDTAKAAYNAAEADYSVKQRAVEVARATLTFAERGQADTIVRAPFAGVVTDKAAQPGEIVSPSSAGGGFTRTGIGTIVDMDSLEVEVDVSENFINRVRAGGAATVKLNAYPDWEIPAEVIAVIPTADRSKATVKVRVGFKQKDERILPEMGARVSFLSEPTAGSKQGPGRESQTVASEAVVVPAEAVQANGETGVIFVLAGGRAERRTVRLGAHTADGQIILSGLTAGTQVAVGGLDQLSDGARIHIEEGST